MNDKLVISAASIWLVFWFIYAFDRNNFFDVWSSEKLLDEVVSIEFMTVRGSVVRVHDKEYAGILMEPFRSLPTEGYVTEDGLILENRVGHVVMRVRGTRLRESRRTFNLYRDPWGLQGISDLHVDVYGQTFRFPEPLPDEIEAILIELETKIRERR